MMTTDVSLEQFAAIQAAQQDGFSLADVLDVEGVDEQSWQDSYKQHVMALASDAEVQEQYQRLFEEAQDRLHVTVEPLFDSVGAWVSVLQLVESSSSSSICDQHGLTMGDFGRLERHWRERFGSDEELAHEARRLRKEGAVEVLTIQVGERVLIASSSGKAEEPAVAEDDGAGAVQEVDGDELERMAALEAYLDEGIAFARLQARFEVSSPEEARALVGRFSAAVLDRNSQMLHRQRVEHYRRLAAQGRRSEVETGNPMVRPAELPVVAQHVPAPVTMETVSFSPIQSPGAWESKVLPFLDDVVVVPPRVAHLLPSHGAYGETAGMSQDALDALIKQAIPSTPFEEEPAQASSPPPVQSGVGLETAALDLNEVRAVVAALPFGSSLAQTGATVARPTPIAESLPDHSAQGATSAMDQSAIDAVLKQLGHGLPSVSPIAQATASSSAAVSGSETEVFDQADLAGMIAAAVPFDSSLELSGEQGTLPMSIDQYAAMVARTEGRALSEKEPIHRGYEIEGAAHRERVDKVFSSALSRDPAVKRQYEELLMRWREWVRQQG